MTEAIGPNWMDYFDLLIFQSKKPKFFSENNEYRKFETLGGTVIKNFTEYIENIKTNEEKVVKYGHAIYLNEYFIKNVKKEFKFLFYGDSIVSDCVYAINNKMGTNWDIVLILEEL